ISWCSARTAASALATSSLKPDGVLLQVIERNDLQGHRMGGLEHHLGGAAGIERLLPARRAQAPAVARLEAGEAVLRHRRREVVAPGFREGEELRRHDDANRVQAHVLAAGVATGIAIEAGQRLSRTG